tara:strand:+ start:1480 stop:2502 length:1023 start_codon:yes stop_codon:yes gene_type:complete
MRILVTGAAGFIGYHLSKELLSNDNLVIGLDNFNNYYDPKLKEARFNNLKEISSTKKMPFKMIRGDINDQSLLNQLFEEYKFDNVVNLAAQAGVRYSITNPNTYIQSNLVGFANILECCRNFKIKHLVYASSSSVYGGNTSLPFSEEDGVDHPVSLYAATKKSNELMAHVYSHIYSIPSTGLRFFTVYGPWGRPDMALFLFTKSILEGSEIKVFNEGEMIRDFTYIDDIIESLKRIIDKPPKKNKSFDTNKPDPGNSWAPHKIFNIGNSKPTKLMDYITAIENSLNKKAKKDMQPMQVGDVKATFANTTKLESWIKFKPSTSINKGINNFVEWYKNFYGV